IHTTGRRRRIAYPKRRQSICGTRSSLACSEHQIKRAAFAPHLSPTSALLELNNEILPGDLLSAARTKPGELTLASIPTFRVAFEMLRRAAGVNTTFVPSPGNAPAVSALLGDHVTSVLAVYPTVAEQIKAGRIRAVVTTSQKRIEPQPELPTVAEAGYRGYSEE